MVVNNVNLTDPSQQGTDPEGGGGVVWVASPRHPPLKQPTEKKIHITHGKTNGNTWVEKTL